MQAQGLLSGDFLLEDEVKNCALYLASSRADLQIVHVSPPGILQSGVQPHILSPWCKPCDPLPSSAELSSSLVWAEVLQQSWRLIVFAMFSVCLELRLTLD